MSWLRWFKAPPVVPIVQLSGGIDFKTVHFVKRSIRLAAAKRNLSAMAVLISSEGGSGAQADIVAHLLREFCDQKGIKLYGFVDKYACSSALLPLAAADHVFVHPDSILGGCAASASHFKLDKTLGLTSWDSSSHE
jgi:ClpP class serine protease